MAPAAPAAPSAPSKIRRRLALSAPARAATTPSLSRRSDSARPARRRGAIGSSRITRTTADAFGSRPSSLPLPTITRRPPSQLQEEALQVGVLRHVGGDLGRGAPHQAL